MARAMTAASNVCNPKGRAHKHDAYSGQDEAGTGLAFLLVKNLMFWGSISLSLYVLYAIVAAL
ncbi:hypothetical protein [Roseibium aggregatum]|uniref:Uncharacterized protein n=1 Tax=Roseibium aggregatum TaxID=187304 RepID=A0A939EAL4_9HYPH|nr:hypothetical protein [Roseibium aggregatum]MBN9669650.1 hypothetical protein [Roseibium aggregatum]